MGNKAKILKKNAKAVNALAKYARQNAGKGNPYYIIRMSFEWFGKNCGSDFTPLPNRVKALFRQLKSLRCRAR